MSGNLSYEKRDIHAGPIARMLVLLGVVTGVSALITLGVFLLLRGMIEKGEPTLPALAQHDENRPFPEPRLQTSPPRELHEVRGEERHQLEHYGWVDKSHGVAHIPIDEAMKMIVLRGSTGGPSVPTPPGALNPSPAPEAPGAAPSAAPGSAAPASAAPAPAAPGAHP